MVSIFRKLKSLWKSSEFAHGLFNEPCFTASICLTEIIVILESRRLQLSNAHCSFWNWNRLDFRNHNENRQSSCTAIWMYRASQYRFGVVGLKSGRKSTKAGLQLWALPARLYGLRGASLFWCCGEYLIDAVMCCVLDACAKTIHAIAIIFTPLCAWIQDK